MLVSDVGVWYQRTDVEMDDMNRWELWGKKTSAPSETLLEAWTPPDTGTVYLDPGPWDFTLKGFTERTAL
jgi:hypothetical protein